MRPIWEKAAAEGFVPPRVPTSAGPQPLDAIFVTHDPGKLAQLDDDGSVIVLSQPTADAWIAAGAQALDDAIAVGFDEQLGLPTPILDLFPELAAALEAGEARGEIRAAWVRGLKECAGSRRTRPAVARDASGLVLIDRGGACSRARRTISLHSCWTTGSRVRANACGRRAPCRSGF
jgi:hypothetical protein